MVDLSEKKVIWDPGRALSTLHFTYVGFVCSKSLIVRQRSEVDQLLLAALSSFPGFRIAKICAFEITLSCSSF